MQSYVYVYIAAPTSGRTAKSVKQERLETPAASENVTELAHSAVLPHRSVHVDKGVCVETPRSFIGQARFWGCVL